MISKIRTGITLILSWIIYYLSFLVPKNKKVWVFLGWRKNSEREIFGDNSKYVFLHTINNFPNIRAIWIAKDKAFADILTAGGYEAYPVKSFRGVWYSLRAQYTIADAFLEMRNWRLSGGSRFVQLWHGKGPKKTGFDSPYSLQRYNKFLFPHLFPATYFFAASSSYTGKLMARTFNAPQEKVKVTGLPRDDVLFGKIKGADIDAHPELAKKLPELKQKKFKKVIFYAPTFRPDGTNPLHLLDFKTLNDVLKHKKYFLIVSLHPKFAAKDWMPKIHFSHIDFISSGYDLYPLLPQFDMLITDYSSTYVDFLLLDKPIIFFVPDIEKYRAEMGLHEEFWNLLPGEETKTFTELLQAIAEEEGSNAQKRENARKKLFAFRDGNSSKRVIEYILCLKA